MCEDEWERVKNEWEQQTAKNRQIELKFKPKSHKKGPRQL